MKQTITSIVIILVTMNLFSQNYNVNKFNNHFNEGMKLYKDSSYYMAIEQFSLAQEFAGVSDEKKKDCSKYIKLCALRLNEYVNWHSKSTTYLIKLDSICNNFILEQLFAAINNAQYQQANYYYQVYSNCNCDKIKEHVFGYLKYNYSNMANEHYIITGNYIDRIEIFSNSFKPKSFSSDIKKIIEKYLSMEKAFADSIANMKMHIELGNYIIVNLFCNINYNEVSFPSMIKFRNEYSNLKIELIETLQFINKHPRLPSYIFELQSFIKFKNMRQIDLSHTIPNLISQPELTDIFTSLTFCSNLESLDISYNNIDKIPNNISKLVNLKSLILIGNPLSYNEINKIEKILPFCKIIWQHYE